jgi:hypothetical protein
MGRALLCSGALIAVVSGLVTAGRMVAPRQKAATPDNMPFDGGRLSRMGAAPLAPPRGIRAAARSTGMDAKFLRGTGVDRGGALAYLRPVSTRTQ